MQPEYFGLARAISAKTIGGDSGHLFCHINRRRQMINRSFLTHPVTSRGIFVPSAVRLSSALSCPAERDWVGVAQESGRT